MESDAARSLGVAVASFPSRPIAELARCYLLDQGIDAAVDADDGNGTQPEVGFVTGGARVMVAAGEVATARDLLAAVGPAPTGIRSHGRLARWVAGSVATTMALLGVWTVVALLGF